MAQYLDSLLNKAATTDPNLVDNLAGEIPDDIKYKKPDQLQAARNLNRKLSAAGFTLPTQAKDKEQPPFMVRNTLANQTGPKAPRNEDIYGLSALLQPKQLDTRSRVLGGLSALGAGLKNVSSISRGEGSRYSPGEAAQKTLAALNPPSDVPQRLQEKGAVMQFSDMMAARDPNSAKSKQFQSYLRSKGFSGDLSTRSYNDLVNDAAITEFLKSIQPQDPKTLAEIRKIEAEAQLKEHDVEQLGTEEQRRQNMLEFARGVGLNLPDSTPLEQLEKIVSSDAAKEKWKEFELSKAKAMGGISQSRYGVGGKGGDSLQTALQSEMFDERAKYLSPQQQKSMQAIAESDIPSSRKDKLLERYDDLSFENERTDRAYAEATIKDIYAKDQNTQAIYSALQEVDNFIGKSGDIPGWGRLTSTMRKLPLGDDLIKAFSSDPEVHKLLTKLHGLKQEYGRSKSGGVIGKDEWIDFETQLGMGAFSTPQQLRIGVRTMINSIKNKVANQWSSVPETVRSDPKYIDRLRIFGVKPDRGFASPDDAWEAQD